MRRLFEAGADVFRINMSHATHDGLSEIHAAVRKLETEFSRPIGMLVDLQGPKLRIGKFESGAIRLTEGEVVSFVRRESVGGLGRVHLPHPEMHKRRFVLLPLAELAPHVIHPQLGTSVSTLLATVGDTKRVTLLLRD